MANIDKPVLADPTAQKSKLVGDDKLEAREVVPSVVVNSVPAQVVQEREGDSDTVNVHETFVATDEIITDPSSPLAVQIPDAGRGSLDLPIHALGGKTAEQQFADAEKSDEKPASRSSAPKK